jgi:hypothetical protein
LVSFTKSVEPVFQKDFPKLLRSDCSAEYHLFQIETNVPYLSSSEEMTMLEEFAMIPFKFVGSAFHCHQESTAKPQMFETNTFIYLQGKNGQDRYSTAQHLSGNVEVKFYRSANGFLAFEIRTKPFWFIGKLSIFLLNPGASDHTKSLSIPRYRHSTKRY